MASLRIHVGAALDSNAITVFAPIEKAAQRARKNIEKELNGIPRGMSAGPYKEYAKEAIGALDGITKALAKSTREQVAIHKTATNEMKRDTRSAAAVASASGGGSNAGGRSGLGAGNRFARRMGYWGVRNFSPVTPTLSMARRLGGDLARGLGVETNMSSYVSSYVSRQKIAQETASAGYKEHVAGQPITAANTRVSAADLMADTKAAASGAAMDYEDAQKGLAKFVEITGDLETGRATLADMAKLARITGANMEDVVTAAGEISAKLTDPKDKVAAINKLMMQLTGAGKEGAVQLPMFAKQLASVASMSGRFEGNQGQNIGVMASLLQEARQQGGAKSAPQAATAVMSFARMWSSGKKIKAFEAMTGHSVQGADNKTMGPEKLITLMLTAAQQKHGLGEGFDKAMDKMVPDARARLVTSGFEGVFKRAGGGKAGVAAVHEKFESLGKNAALSQAEEAKELALALNETQAQVQRFKNKMQDTADTAMVKLLPALEKLAPLIEKSVDAFAGIVVWAAGNPFEAVAAALALSVTKTGIEQSLRVAIESAFAGSGTAALGGAGGALAGASIVATLGAAAAITLISYGTIEFGMKKIDEYFAEKNKKDGDDAAAGANAAGHRYRAMRDEIVTPEDATKIDAQTPVLNKAADEAIKKVRENSEPENNTFSKIAPIVDQMAETTLGLHGFGSKIQETFDAYSKQLVTNQAATLNELWQQNQYLKMIATGVITVVSKDPKPPVVLVDRPGVAPVSSPK